MSEPEPQARAPETLAAWFTREVLCHEAAFCRFISHLWRDREEQADFRQEAYASVFQAALRAKPEAPKAFLFATARHLIAHRARRERILSIQTVNAGRKLRILGGRKLHT